MWQENAYPTDKPELYEMLFSQLSGLLADEREAIPNLANMSALLFDALKDINWAGFYLMKHGGLLLGPFQGKPACIRIPVGRGVCGTAAGTRKTQLVYDVHQFPGHIACDAASRSEIVIPLLKDGVVLGVLDIDSPRVGRFDEEDRSGLEKLCELLINGCDWACMQAVYPVQ